MRYFCIGDLVEVKDKDLSSKPLVAIVTEVIETNVGCYRVVLLRSMKERIYFEHEMLLLS
jgi:hypothetical protein